MVAFQYGFVDRDVASRTGCRKCGGTGKTRSGNLLVELVKVVTLLYMRVFERLLEVDAGIRK
jgi:hypothetical protein